MLCKHSKLSHFDASINEIMQLERKDAVSKPSAEIVMHAPVHIETVRTVDEAVRRNIRHHRATNKRERVTFGLHVKY